MTIPAELNPVIPSWARMSPKRLAHVTRVAALAHRWATAMAVAPEERDRWLRAAWLHDALRDADDATLAAAAPDVQGPIELRHGPAAAARAEQDGERDQGVLLAVRYHSVGWPEWDMVGRVLYCADFLEPGRTFDPAGCAALAERFPSDPVGVFREVVTRRLVYLIRSGWTMPDATFRLWNSLAAPDSGE